MISRRQFFVFSGAGALGPSVYGLSCAVRKVQNAARSTADL